MKRTTQAVLLLIILLVAGFIITVMAWSKPTLTDPMAVGEMALQDTIAKDTTPITFSVKGQKALFIGDSHTANHQSGWQTQLSKAVGFNMVNTAVGGKTTYWMLEMAVYKLNNSYNYCFIYGGANDMYSSHITIDEAIANIKGIARMCNRLGVKCVILTGFDPIKCTKTPNPNYGGKYYKFQEKLMNEYMEGAQVIDTRVVAKSDCWEGLCHMAPSGHKKIAEKVIKDLAFQKI